MYQPPRLDPALKPQVFVSFPEDFDLPPDQLARFDVHHVSGAGYEMQPTPGAVVFLVGDLARRLGDLAGASGGSSLYRLPNYARLVVDTTNAGVVEFVALPRVTGMTVNDGRDPDGWDLLDAEARRYENMVSASVGWELGEGRTFSWCPALGTLSIRAGKVGTILACADGLHAQPDAEARAVAITHLCHALAGIRRYNGRSKINVARHSILVAEMTRRRGIERRPDDGLSSGRVLEMLATFVGAGHDLPEATGDGDIATPLTRIISGSAREVRNRARAAYFHLVHATRNAGTVADLRAIFAVVTEVDADASALEYGWSFGVAPVWASAHRQELALRMAAARGKLKREPSPVDENAGRHLAGLLIAADTADKAPISLLTDALADHPFTHAALEVMS